MLSSCRQSRAYIVTPDRKLTKFYLSLSRNKLRKLVGFLMGHHQFNKHLHMTGVVTDPGAYFRTARNVYDSPVTRLTLDSNAVVIHT